MKSVVLLTDRLDMTLDVYRGRWLVVVGLTARSDSISVYIGPSPREKEKEERRIEKTENVQTTPNAHQLQAQ